MAKTRWSCGITNGLYRAVRSPIVAVPCSDPMAAAIALRHRAKAGWVGSLELSALLGVPDSYVLSSSQVLDMVLCIQKRTKCALPLIVDVDAGYGGMNSVYDTFVGLNIMRVEMAVLENKKPAIDKRNSMLAVGNTSSDLVSAEEMRRRLSVAKSASEGLGITKVCARFEDLVVGRTVRETLGMIKAVMQARPDAIFVSCKDKSPERLFRVTTRLRSQYPRIPILATTGRYRPAVAREEFFRAGVSILVYANQHARRRMQLLDADCAVMTGSDNASALEHGVVSVEALIGLSDCTSGKVVQAPWIQRPTDHGESLHA
jgi:2-methylisocitrate lyase-like PEP mutase family enzyme